MRKKKVLVHGTAKSLKNFFSDAVHRDFEIVDLMNAEDISSELGVIAPKNFPDGIIFTGEDKSVVNLFIAQGIEPRKIILWDADKGWCNFTLTDKTGTEIVYFYGLEFHIRNNADVKFFNQTYWRIQYQRRIKNLNPQLYPAVLKNTFQQRMGKPLNLDSPKTFTEKLHWLKLYDSTPLKSRLADKYAVRSWIAEKIGAEYLIPLLGVWDNAYDINFDELPNQFVLKCNHGSGMNVICRDKKSFDKQRAREKLNAWLAEDFSTLHLELHYTRINRKIIAEKFMANENLPDLIDYKFWCFDGKPVVVQCETDRSTDLRFDYFDMNFNHTNIERSDHKLSDHPEKIPPPKNFELMKKLAATLAEGFAFVRVDFYEIDGKVYFGEMTFTPGAGNFYYKSAGTDEYLGSLLKLPNATPPPQYNFKRSKTFIPCRKFAAGILFCYNLRGDSFAKENYSRNKFGRKIWRAYQICTGVPEFLSRRYVEPRHSYHLPTFERAARYKLRKIFSGFGFKRGKSNAAE